MTTKTKTERRTQKAKQVNEQYVWQSWDRWGTTYYGSGETAAEALANHRKAGGKKADPHVLNRFTSALPFAPHDRDAVEGEADAYVCGYGALTWVCCDREIVEDTTTAKAN